MKVLKFFGKFIAFILSIIYFVGITALLVASFSLNLVSESYYTDIINNIDLSDLKVNQFGDLFKDAPVDEDASVEDIIVKYFKQESNIDEEVVRNAINNEKVRNLAGKVIGSYVNYSVSGEKPEISKSELQNVLDEPEVKKLLSYAPSDADVSTDYLYKQLNNLIEDMMENGGVNNGNSRTVENVSKSIGEW